MAILTNTLPNKMSFSGADITITAVIPNKYLKAKDSGDKTIVVDKVMEIDNIQTFSYSIHRDTDHSRSIGSDTPNGMVKGQAVIAGTAIFTVITTHILQSIFDSVKYDPVRIDQLPPIDLFLDFQNEAGDAARIGIFGVEWVNEGQVMSIHDLITENSVNYFATAILPMRDLKSFGRKQNVQDLTKSSYELADEKFKAMKGVFL